MAEHPFDQAIRRAVGGRTLTSTPGPSDPASEAWFRGRVNRATGQKATGRRTAGQDEPAPPDDQAEPKEKPRPRGDAGGGVRLSMPQPRGMDTWLRAEFERQRYGG